MPSHQFVTIPRVLVIIVLVLMANQFGTVAGDESEQGLASAIVARLSQRVQGSCEIPGGYQLGESCWPDVPPPGVCECAKGLTCDFHTATCITAPPVRDSSSNGFGDACSFTGKHTDTCGPGLSCHRAKQPVCLHQPRIQGEACNPLEKCAPGFTCKRSVCV